MRAQKQSAVREREAIRVRTHFILARKAKSEDCGKSNVCIDYRSCPNCRNDVPNGALIRMVGEEHSKL